jgi:serine/threonine-protein kinase
VDALEDRRILSIAGLVANGENVDWALQQVQGTDPHTAQVLGEMARVEQIARFHRESQQTATTTVNANGESHAIQTWGHFTILGQIGRGAFGTVYRVKDNRLQSEVALKLWPISPSSLLETRQKEARLLARVRHPNVVTVYGTDYIDGRVGIWMELVKGRTLAQLLHDQGPFGAREAAIIGIDLCRALAAVHRAGLVHGDLKAHNVVREDGGRTVLMDFGSGADVPTDFGDALPTTNFAGTPVYAAPEIFDGHTRTKLSDVYSLGVLLYHLVTGEYPVNGLTRADVADAHRRGDRAYLCDVRSDLPAEFLAVVEQALAVDPGARYQSAGAFETALAPIVGRTLEVVPGSRSRWTSIAISAAAVLALVGGLGYWISRASSTQPNAGVAEMPAHRMAGASGTSVAAATLQTGTSYQIDTALYRVRGTSEDRLRAGVRVVPGDRLFARIRVSVPAYVYIVNEDDVGDSYLLFPLPGQTLTNPLTPGTTHRVPGAVGTEQIEWQVTTAGGREHFLVFVSPENLPAFERMFGALPTPVLGRPIQSAPLSPDTISGVQRSVGGLVSSVGTQKSGTRLTQQFPTPLGEGEETARGLWVRQFTVDNPR